MDLGTALNHTLIYLANGLLVTFYFLWSQGPLLLALVCAATVAAHYDRQTRRVAGERVRRYGRGRQTHASYRPYWETGAAIGLWLFVSLSSVPLISLIGALMLPLPLLPLDGDGRPSPAPCNRRPAAPRPPVPPSPVPFSRDGRPCGSTSGPHRLPAPLAGDQQPVPRHRPPCARRPCRRTPFPVALRPAVRGKMRDERQKGL
jgi:hypothetical protein